MTYLPPALEDIAGASLDVPVMATLGDSIQYQAAGGAFVPLRAYVDYADALRDVSTATIIDQDISVEMLVSDLAAKPADADRITLGKLPGLTFKPINVRRSSGGAHWQFEVRQV